MTHVAVLVPGIMGSELRLGSTVVWPGSLEELVLPYGKMKELLRDDLVATDIIRKFSISHQYDDLIRDLGTCGFAESSNPPTLYVLPYDWRKANELAAKLLADLVDKGVSERDDADVTLIGHSMGGLVCRFYLESGSFTTRTGLSRVRNLVTLGTPHRGAPLALTAAVGLERRLFLNADQVLQLASDPRYPSLYQLLPPASEPFVWNGDAFYQEVDIYDKDIATSLNLVAANLDAARNFQAKLDTTKRPNGVRYFFFAGSHQVTTASVLFRKSSAAPEVFRMEQEDAGDGTVPIWSSLASTIQTQLVGGEHSTIYKDAELRRTLAILLGKPGLLPAVTAEQVQISIRERVVEPQERVHVILSFIGGAPDVDGRLQFQAMKMTDGPEEPSVAIGSPLEVRYSGTAADRIGVVVTAPQVPGLYRLVFSDATGRELGSDDLFVQQPA